MLNKQSIKIGDSFYTYLWNDDFTKLISVKVVVIDRLRFSLDTVKVQIDGLNEDFEAKIDRLYTDREALNLYIEGFNK